MQLENKELCAECGGKCCKNGGCEFSANDFAIISVDELQKHLDNGLISITSDIIIDNQGNFSTFLSVRMRNIGGKPIDFLQNRPAPCHALKSYGCPFSFVNRPSGGKYLVPSKYDECHYIKEVYTTWAPYQNVLRELVIRNTGLTPEEKISERLEEIFYEFFQLGIYDENFAYCANLLEELGENLFYFRSEMKRALERCKNENKLNRTNPLIGYIH